MPYSKIAKILRLSNYQIQHLCSYKPKVKAIIDQDRVKASILQKCHIDYIRAEMTLTKLAGNTLVERARLFEVRFPGKRLSATQLRGIYKQLGIKKKKVEQLKLIPNRD